MESVETNFCHVAVGLSVRKRCSRYIEALRLEAIICNIVSRFHEIIQDAKLLRSHPDKLVSKLETADNVTSKLATSQLPTSILQKPRRNTDKNHDKNQDEFCATLLSIELEVKSIVTEVKRLKSSLEPNRDGLSTRALQETGLVARNATQATTPAQSATQRNATSMQKASASHSTKVEAVTREPEDENESKTTVVPPLSGVQKVPAVKEPTIATTTAREDAKALRFTCEAANLGDNMVCTIEKARKILRRGNVNEHGYLILNVKLLPAVD